MLIQVDIDSTLYDSDALFAIVAKEFDIVWPKKYYKWFGPEEIGTDLQTLKNIFKRAHSREYVMQNTPYEGAVDVLRGIAEDYEEVELAYISDRNEQQGAALKDWLEQEGFLTDANEHVAATADKRHWMREMRPEIVIDDRVRTMIMARYELNSMVVSLEHNHNSNLIGEVDGIYIVPTWKDIDNVLRNIIVREQEEKSLARA